MGKKSYFEDFPFKIMYNNKIYMYYVVMYIIIFKFTSKYGN